jgi:hypothetical protein
MILVRQATTFILLVVGATTVVNGQNTQYAPDEVTDFCFVSGSAGKLSRLSMLMTFFTAQFLGPILHRS